MSHSVECIPLSLTEQPQHEDPLIYSIMHITHINYTALFL